MRFFLLISLILYKICHTKSLVLSENDSTSFINYVIIIFLCLSLYLRFFQGIFNFIIYPMYSSILSYICLMKIFSSIRKYAKLIFQMYSNCISLSVIVLELFFKEIFSFKNYLVILNFIHMLDENFQFYAKMALHTFH